VCVCVCVCVYASALYVCVCVRVYTFTYVHVCACVYVCVCVCVCVCVYACVCVCMYLCVYVSVFVCVCVCVCVLVSVCETGDAPPNTTSSAKPLFPNAAVFSRALPLYKIVLRVWPCIVPSFQNDRLCLIVERRVIFWNNSRIHSLEDGKKDKATCAAEEDESREDHACDKVKVLHH
jgi:hypothetical protein